MLVTFSTPTHADITMFGEIALAMLTVMGHSASVPGAILAEDVAAARDRLRAAIEADRTAPVVAVATSTNDSEPAVSFTHRALPLLDLLSAAMRDQRDVIWK